jgi:hypothetical protein
MPVTYLMSDICPLNNYRLVEIEIVNDLNLEQFRGCFAQYGRIRILDAYAYAYAYARNLAASDDCAHLGREWRSWTGATARLRAIWRYTRHPD